LVGTMPSCSNVSMCFGTVPAETAIAPSSKRTLHLVATHFKFNADLPSRIPSAPCAVAIGAKLPLCRTGTCISPLV
jgi:hypothetical protein